MPSIVWRQSIVHFLSHSPDLFLSLMNIVWQAKHILNDVVLAQSKMYSDSWMWRLCNCQARQLRYARAIEETLNDGWLVSIAGAPSNRVCNRFVRPRRKSYFHGKSCLFIHFSRLLKYLFIFHVQMLPSRRWLHSFAVCVSSACVYWIGSGATISIDTSFTDSLFNYTVGGGGSGQPHYVRPNK